MGNKPKMKPGKNELIRRTNVLMGEAQKTGNWLNYLNNLLVRYIEYKGDTKKFGKFLEEMENADKEKSRKLRKSSGSNKDTGSNKQATKRGKQKPVSSSKSTKKSDSTENTGETGHIGV